mgnify:CR=1 FL=1
MGFFDRFKKDKGIELTAPMKGKCVSIKEVPDPTFAEAVSYTHLTLPTN